MTTPVEVKYADGSSSSGSGFFFFVLGPRDPSNPGPQWQSVDKTYVITNKHVIQPEKLSNSASLTFSLRKKTADATEWYPILLKGDEIGKHVHILRDSPADVAAIDVTDVLNRTMGQNEKTGTQFEPLSGVSKDNFPGVSPLTIESGDDVVVVGYPRLFTDEYNKLPVLKLSLLITPWGLRTC